MIQGATSDAGKSFVVTALCRIFSDKGWNVTPYKSQNMSNNSYVTRDGEEIGRAQGVQAEAARVEPQVYMNPILLKPRSNCKSEIILMGKVYTPPNSDHFYRDFRRTKGLETVRSSLKMVAEHHDLVVIEGAGSPAEINLNQDEIVNMRVAKEADVPVFLVVDIDRGGMFAHVVGTLDLLGEDRHRVKGIIINKFRGDISLLTDGLDWLEKRTGVKVVGVIPYEETAYIESEDSLSMRFPKGENRPIQIGLIPLQRVSNYTDLEIFNYEKDVTVQLLHHEDDIERMDAIVIPGTKSTLDDLQGMMDSGFAEKIKAFHAGGGFVAGICGGYQMLGKTIRDPEQVDRKGGGEIKGLGLLEAYTTFKTKKSVQQVKGHLYQEPEQLISGYEIHFGKTQCCYSDDFKPLFSLDGNPEGMVSWDGRLMGSYLHNIFHNDRFRQNWLNAIRKKKGVNPHSMVDTSELKEKSYSYIAQMVEKALDMDYIYELLQ